MSTVKRIFTYMCWSVAIVASYNISSQSTFWYEPMNTDPIQSAWSGTPLTLSSSSCGGTTNHGCSCWRMDTQGAYSRTVSTISYSLVEFSYRLNAGPTLNGPDGCLIDYSVDDTNFINIITHETASAVARTYTTWSVDNIASLTLRLTFTGGGHNCYFSEFKLSGIPSDLSHIPTNISSTMSTWDDDYDIDSSRGWYITLPWTQKRYVTSSCSTGGRYHGPYRGVNKGGIDTIINIERQFYCEGDYDSIVTVAYTALWCAHLQYTDYQKLFINNEVKSTITGNEKDWTAFSDPGVTGCSYSWEQKHFPSLTYSKIVAANELFTVKVSILTDYSYSQPETLYFYGMQITCNSMTREPSISSGNPSSSPTLYPTIAPTPKPTDNPITATPTANPSNPTNQPTIYPTVNPTPSPTAYPTVVPTNIPTSTPITTLYPSSVPSQSPIAIPPFLNSANPTIIPAFVPTRNPSLIPTFGPTNNLKDGQVNEISTLEPDEMEEDDAGFLNEANFFGLPLIYGIVLVGAFIVICVCKALVIWYYMCSKRSRRRHVNETQNVIQMIDSVASGPDSNATQTKEVIASKPGILTVEDDANTTEQQITHEMANECNDSNSDHEGGEESASSEELYEGANVDGAPTTGGDDISLY